MYTFGSLLVGDMFNTTPARWVKVSHDEAICVMSVVVPLGTIEKISQDHPVILLWSCVLNTE